MDTAVVPYCPLLHAPDMPQGRLTQETAWVATEVGALVGALVGVGVKHAEAEHGHAGRGHDAKSTLNPLPTSATNHCEKSAHSPRSMELAHSANTLRQAR